jgi:tetratricopeptide (TPR) repeat protein
VSTSTQSFHVTHLDEVDALANWLPLRRRLGVTAFGVNAWTGDEEDEVIGEHDETESGHEELYLVVRGRATFSVGGDDVDGPPGTIVFVRNPATKRKAVAREAGTLVFTLGAKAGEAYEPLGWEENAEILELFRRGEYGWAKERLLLALDRFPDTAALYHYNLACAESRLGETDAALEHLQASIERESRFAEYAQTDEDLEAIRSDPRFPSA